VGEKGERVRLEVGGRVWIFVGAGGMEGWKCWWWDWGWGGGWNRGNGVGGGGWRMENGGYRNGTWISFLPLFTGFFQGEYSR